MSTLQSSARERNTVQAINALKRGSYLLKYGRWGKPTFCPFRLSNDETTLIWYVGKEEKQLRLSQVSRIIPGQRTATFQRYPQPEKEYQSFSLIYGKRSLDVICKDKSEAEIWFLALRALISPFNNKKWKMEIQTGGVLSSCSSDPTNRDLQSNLSNSKDDAVHKDKQIHPIINAPSEKLPGKRLRNVLSDYLLYNATSQCSPHREFVRCSHSSQSDVDDSSCKTSSDTLRTSFSSAISASSQDSSLGDIPLSNIFLWGKGVEYGLLGGSTRMVGDSFPRKDAFLPKVLESASVLDPQNIACGSRHAVLVTSQGRIFSWGDGSGGKLGHGLEADISNPKLIDTINGQIVVSIGCGEYHTCAVTLTGDLYTWGDGIHNIGLLGHGNELSYWTPQKVRGQMEGIHVTSISCGPWHSAAITSTGQLFTFGDGTFGALGHGDRSCTSVPREVETLKGQKAVRVSCGFWHTAAVVEIPSESPTCNFCLTGKVFTWGNGDQGQLGHGDKLCRLVPCCVSTPSDRNFCQVACGHSITIALTSCGHVYSMGGADCGELRGPGNSHAMPVRIEAKIKNCFIEEISCGSHHVVALTSKSEVFTWGKGKNGQLGHGDSADRNSPTLVDALNGKQVKRVICGNNFTAAICLHQRVCVTYYSVCAGCSSPFNFRRKRHNCYNCGLVFCKACTSNKSPSASLAPNKNKSYRICEDCFAKVNKCSGSRVSSRPPKSSSRCGNPSKVKEQETSKAKHRGILYRLSSFDSFRRSSKQLPKKNLKLDSGIKHNSPFHEGEFECDRSYTSSPSTSMFDYSEKINASLPGLKIHSLSSSPVSTKSSPPRSMSFPSLCTVPYPEEVIDGSKNTNDDLTEEISSLKEQVEVLTRKSQLLAVELERTSNQLKEATEWFQDETEKNKAAKEAIKYLMKKLKDMAVTVPQGTTCRVPGPFADNMFYVLSTASTRSPLTG
ncbi:hypothetical protein ACJIZ3_003375 [Penstemon smallii]|uniref:FYVE-type domain-containing protein n=1 Tax=Penstemon smallii TaxID=265156 RepID=A0ABD3U923_9LAMI